MNLSNNFSLFLDANTYDYNILIGKQGTDVTTGWTSGEGSTHWDEAGAPHILYVHNLATDVHFDMQSTGFRLGAKYYIFGNKIHPWVGAGYGFYKWTVNYFNSDKTQTYGTDDGYVFGLTYLGGVRFKIMKGLDISLFADLASPVAFYTINGLFYPQWNIKKWDSPIFGTQRFGFTLFF